MFDVLARLGRWLAPKQRRKLKRSSIRVRSAADLVPTLQVRTLEERRVFHAGALGAPQTVAPQAAANQQPPPPPTTTITLDAGHNLLVQDLAAGGKNDQLAIRFDATHGGYVITSATQPLVTDISGARGSGTNQVFIPVVEVSGGKLIVATGDGNDSLSVDLSQGLGDKALIFDGGAGNDAVTLGGGSYGSVGYVFSADGTTQIQAGQGAAGSLVELRGVEPVQDQLIADVRRFTIGGGIASATLGNDGIAASGMTKLTTSLGTSVVFVTPLSRLTLDAGSTGQIAIAGTTNLNGADLTVRAGSLDVSGAIVSHHATIDLAATTSLTVTASSVIENAAGRVLLDAGASGTLAVSGRIDVTATAAGGVGGTVHLLGDEVKLLDQAVIDASGHSGGGTVLVGGDYQGLNPLVRRATNTFISSEASITANALASGNGGKIIVWADEVAIVAGSGNLQARGGSRGGHGGFIETSGKRYLAIGGAADAGSPRGIAGTWLLDPFNVEIVAGSGGTIPGSGDFTPAANTTIGADTIEAALATTNVTIFTGTGGNNADGNITVSSAISVALGAGVTRTLALNAAHNVIVAASITATTGSLNVALNANSTAGGQADPDNTVGSVTISGAITTLGGTFSSTGLNFTNTGTIATGAGTVSINHNADITLRADITTTAAATIVTSAGDIAFDSAAKLTAASATLTATGGTITADEAGTDIDTSTVGGAITLSGTTGIGSSTRAITVAASGGAVTATTGDASIYLESTTDLNLGQITTGAGANTVSITADSAAGLDISIGATSTTNDNWTLTATGNIAFSGAVRLNAGSATLDAGGSLVSGTDTVDIDTHLSNGAISLTGDLGIGTNANRFLVRADDGLVTASTDDDNGDIFLGSTGSLDLGAVTTKVGAHTVNIQATTNTGDNIAIEATSDTDDNWTLIASGNIAFVGSAHLDARSATLDAGGALVSGTNGVDVDTHDFDGDITLTGDLGIGADTNFFRVRADDGTVTAATTDAAGHIYLRSTASLDLGVISTGTGAQTIDIRADSNAADTIALEASSTTDDNWSLLGEDGISLVGGVTLTANSASLTADGGSVLGGTATRDIITTTSVTIDADAIGTGADALVLRPGSGTVSLDADNGAINVAIETQGTSFQTSKLTLVRNTTLGGSTVTITVLDGQLTLDGAAGFQSLANDDVTLSTAGTDNTIHLASATTFDVDSLTLAASGAITSANNTAVLTTGNTQEITLTADAIGTLAAPVVVQPGETLSVTAGGDIYLRQATGNLATSVFTLLTSTGSGGVVSIGTLAGNVIIDDISGFSSLTDDTLVIQAAGAGADIVFDTTLTTGDVTLIAADRIISDGSNNADINTSAVDGDIQLSAGGRIGDSGNELRVTADDGIAAIATTTATGDAYLLSMGDLQLATVTTDGGTSQTVQIGTTTGDLTLTVDNTSNDNVRLRAAGDLIVSDDVTTTALTFTDIRAGGAVISGGTAEVDFRTTGLATDVLTITGGSVGTQGNPLQVDHEGKYALTATGDLWLLIADGNLLTSDINSVIMPTAGTTLGLITAGGSITVDSNILSGLTNKELHLEARGAGSNINLDPVAGTLTFAAVTLLAENGAITNLNAGLAIDTSAAGGNITLRTLGAIGANGSPVVVQAGAGQVSATTTGAAGDIYLRSQSQFHLGLIDAEDSGVQTIQLTSDLGIDIEVASATEDDWELVALAGNIDFVGAGSLTANSVSLTASGDILGGTATTDIDTSATNGLIHLEANGIGGSANPLAIAPGSGDLEVIANDGDVYLLVNSTGLAMSQFSVLTFGAVGHVFDLTLADGNLAVDIPVALAGTEAVLRTVGTNANIDFGAAGSLSAAEVTLSATSAITAVAGGVDVTSAGDITLTGNLGIGAPAAPLVVQHGAAGTVTATTTTGNIYLFSPGELNLGVVTTGGGSAQTVDVRAALDLLVSGASTTNDNWTLAANGNIEFTGAGSVAAANLTATTPGQLLGGGAAADVTVTGTANLSAAAGVGTALNRVSVVTGASGLVNATTTQAAAAVYLESPGLIRVGQIATAVGLNVVLICDQGGTSEFEIVGVSNTDDDWTLDSGGNIAFVNSSAITAHTFTADADGNITSGNAAVEINTSPFSGIIDLDAGGSIGTQFNPLAVSAWPAPVRANAQTGDVFLTSPGHLLVDQASAGGVDPDVWLTTTGALTQLIARVPSLGNDQWHLLGTGNINLEVAGSMQWSQVEDLRSSGVGRNIFVSTDTGPMLVNVVHGGVMTADDNLTLLASSGNLQFTNAAPLRAANANLFAFDGSILTNGDTTRIAVTEELLLVAFGLTGTIGSAGDAFGFSAPEFQSFAAESQWLVAAAPTRVIQAETFNAGGSISFVEGTFFLATSPSLPPNTPSVATTMLHVEEGALLGGSGIVQGGLHVLADGMVNMGFGQDEAGLLRVQGNIAFDAGSELVVDINSPYIVAGRDYDHVQVTGNVFLNNSTLTLRGAEDLRVTINPLILFDLAPGMTTTGGFAIDNISLFLDGSDVRARVGQFRGKLSFFGGPDNNDIILNDLSLVPPVQQTGFRLPPPSIPVFTRSEQLPVVVQSPPPLTTSVEAPAIEVETEAVSIRYLEIRIVVPIDEAGNVEEVFALKLPAEWLTNLPAILRRLPDDRYRIYLILEGGSEERLVMDVLVRDGRPVEPNESQALDADAAQPAVADPAAEPKNVTPAPAEPAPLPALPDLPPAGFRDQRAQEVPNAGRFFVGASAAVAAVVASRRSSDGRAKEADDVAEAIGRATPPNNSRWWRFSQNTTLSR